MAYTCMVWLMQLLGNHFMFVTSVLGIIVPYHHNVTIACDVLICRINFHWFLWNCLPKHSCFLETLSLVLLYCQYFMTTELIGIFSTNEYIDYSSKNSCDYIIYIRLIRYDKNHDIYNLCTCRYNIFWIKESAVHTVLVLT